MPKSSFQEVICKNCGVLFRKRVNHDKPGKHYCSNNCRKSDKDSFKSEWTDERRAKMSDKMTGENNPNYGNNWTEEQKAHLSHYKIKQYAETPDLRHECGKSNRGVKFSKERIQSMHRHRTAESYKRSHSDHSRKKIGEKSKEKWTNGYKEQHRTNMESLGYWAPRDQIDPYMLYYKDANWKGNMIQYFSDEYITLLNEYGIFSKTNSKGYVRDHIVSRKMGYENRLPTFVLRHPANLQFISHAENISKGFSDRRLTDIEKHAIIESLFDRILRFSKPYHEQEMCFTFIKERRAV
jgi:hypothetical protein